VQDVGAALSAIEKRIRVLVLPGLPPKGDVADWLAAATRRSTRQPAMPAADKSEETDEADQKAKAEQDDRRLLDELAA